MPTKPSLPAKLVQVLDWYEVPELVLLEAPNLEFILAVRSGDLDADDNVYVGGSMSLRRLRDYANGKCDLRFALAHANMRRFWTFKLSTNSQDVELKSIKRTDSALLKSIPQPGLFATDHEDIDRVKVYVPDTIEEFKIDGSWDLGEFSQLYSQIEDVYYLSSDIERFDDPEISFEAKQQITDAFDRSWDGGGSYVAFYRKVANDNDYHAPLRVRGIEYNSPGFVKLYAKAEYFANLMEMLQYFADHETEIKKAATQLGAFMSVSKMKQKGFRNGHMTDAQRENLEALAETLSEQIPCVSFKTIRAMTNGNSLIAAKVLESIFRRLKRLYQYFDEGRVKHESLTVR